MRRDKALNLGHTQHELPDRVNRQGPLIALATIMNNRDLTKTSAYCKWGQAIAPEDMSPYVSLG